ncbi:Cellobiose dehydrogenase [Pyrenophora tritici-repentis]|nr:Cellobiose dehydrogenase [Pyrenophora tritici-repentis]KAI0614035.1 Cellobiose dehydrogenase [Pyrenophora tritici-repentis]KAI0627063.1 Cellobiose dehydrogenase [Pyrenophora tritici-repentis]KAI2484013.1 Cellobiose dehydrogenase [Pyrenophora tritici-repentis]
MVSSKILAGAALLGLSAAQDTYDYVIVGGGVTGLIVANRLSEDKQKSVLVIEAGGADDNPNIRLPYAASYPVNTSLVWQNYVCQPEPFLGNGTWNTRVAKVLGGGSIVNGMMYDRGSAADYDAWEALGNKGWGWAGMYPFFKKGTEFVPPPEATVKQVNITWDPEAYGDGPLKLGISDTQFTGILDYFEAYEGTGGAHAAIDGNNGEAYGTSWYPNTMNPRTGERSHARNSYYEPVMSRPNLHVVLESTATQLIFDGTKQLTAKGVKVNNKNGSTTYYAKKELILACGAVNTPILLQNSGIGPKSVLQAAGIPVKLEHDGVGTNFQDHPYSNIQFNISNLPSGPGFGAIDTDPAYNASAWAQYLFNRTGPLTQARGNALAMIPLPVVDPENYNTLSDRVRALKDNEYLPAIYKNSKKLLKGVRAQRKVLADLFQNDKAAIVEYPIPSAGIYLLVGLEKPVSRGTIMINPANPQGPPLISYNALSNPVDKSVLAACIRYIRRVWAGPELERFTPVETFPGTKYQTDDEIIDKSVEMGAIWPTLSHPSGSCAMLPEDMGGCVSDELLFYGVENMSIIDASIIPLIPSQHIQSTMYAIGEKAAGIIKSRG